MEQDTARQILYTGSFKKDIFEDGYFGKYGQF